MGLCILHRVHDDVRIVVFDDAAILEDDASLHPPLGVFGRLDLYLQEKTEKRFEMQLELDLRRTSFQFFDVTKLCVCTYSRLRCGQNDDGAQRQQPRRQLGSCKKQLTFFLVRYS